MREYLLLLVAGLAALGGSATWADPGKDESGHGDFERFHHYAGYQEADREALKARREYEREAAKARAELEREERKHYEEMRRETRKHREEMRREAHKHHDEMWREGVVETIDYYPSYD